MLSKTNKDLENQTSTNDDQPKAETSLEYDPYGANQFDHIDKDNIDEGRKRIA
ncbi:hypothetical protein [Legionella parisiensis]|uniref:Uncharacterized protein n=1 Tax=Legionella parisiensis TaxID=45071 RepID=A0A1E5JMM1_9GAMM|nr:hypothetical protein [Legionella parisiensis]KTD41703.1 hypothetical protein Lpar_3020 [Legionella parisiensis]OEH45720.1 hypothetical protein lpari_03233 [Legionella parisiensis]STX75975.1 Uncharacterised protein [Legionella parisiensis]